MEPTRVRLHILISQKFSQAIDDYMHKYGATKTQAVSRMAGIGKYIIDAQENGETVIVGKQAMRFNL